MCRVRPGLAMRVIVNGEEKDVAAGLTVAGLLDLEGMPAAHVLVEVNGEYYPARRLPDRTLVEGDTVEIILPLFGG
jgi:sulfur carrier protein